MRQTVMAMMALLLTACGGGNPQGEPKAGKKILRTALPTDPMSLDPRIGGNRVSQVVIRMLFEGLTRISPEGNAEPAMAESVEVSDNGTLYTFRIRDAVWSDGTPVTAHDFVYSWKKVLSPNFDSRFAYAFYPIKNAEAAKLGEVAVDDVGLWAVDDKTLLVELEHPAPYFLDHIANPVCAPVPAGIDERSPRWCDSAATMVCNGIFKLAHWNHESELRLDRNPTYWEADVVALDGLNIAIIDDARTSFALFEQGKLDYLGEPFSDLPLEAMPGLKAEGKLITQHVNGIYQYLFNCERFPFTSSKIRCAFACALDRTDLVKNLLKGNEVIATSLLPPTLTLNDRPLLKDGDVHEARRLFAEGLEELGITHQEFPEVEIMVGQIEGYKAMAQAIQQRWQKVFDISVRLETVEWTNNFSRLASHDYMVGSTPWYSWYDDAMYNLEQIKYAHKGLSMSAWEDPVYMALLDCADHELSEEKRLRYLRQAEKMAMEAMPLVPIHVIDYKFVKQPHLHGDFISSKGMIDFKWARLGETQFVQAECIK